MLSFHVKYVQTDRWTDGKTDNSKLYIPDLSMRGHKNTVGKAETTSNA